MITEEKISMQEWCNNLNRKIHKPIFLENFLLPDDKKHCKAFTSIDLIEDTENAIEEFEKLPDDIFSNRSTLYIYGILQALYCQQDALQHLYESIFGINFNDFQEFINHLTGWDYIGKIRTIRNEIAGHPTSRKKGKEFYFIAKGGNSKYNFEYGGYKPEFKSVKVDLKEFILKQKEFTFTVLDCVDKEIENKIMAHKSKFKNQKLVDKVSSQS